MISRQYHLMPVDDGLVDSRFRALMIRWQHKEYATALLLHIKIFGYLPQH